MQKNNVFSTQNDILKAVLSLILEQGWKDLNLDDISRNLSISLAELHRFFPSKRSILEAFFKHVDQQNLDNLESFQTNEAARNRLFSILMTRLDVLKDYKPLILELTQESWKDPCLIIQALPQSFNTFSWLLEASAMDPNGLLGTVRLNIFAVFYGSVILTWLKDDTPDMAPTMAFLDKAIDRLDQIPGFF